MPLNTVSMNPQNPTGYSDDSLLSSKDAAPVNDETNPPSFYDNLVNVLDEDHIHEITREVIDRSRDDIESHQPYLTLIAKTIENLGLNRSRNTSDQPNPGSAMVADPALLKAGNDIAARIMAQFWNTDKPVKTVVMGNSDPIKLQKASRVRDYMSFQLQQKIAGYYEQDDKMFYHLPFIGTGFKKIYWNGKAIVTEYVSPENLVVPYEAESLLRAERITHIMRMSKYEFKSLVKSKFYADLDLRPAFIEATQIDRQNDAILGNMPSIEPERYEICECHCLLEMNDLYPDQGELPYIVSYERSSSRVVRLSRNWDIEDITRARSECFVDYKFFPWKGVYGLGLTHQVGNLSATASNILSELITSGMKQNMITGLKLHNDMDAQSGAQIRLEDGKFSDIKLPANIKRIEDAFWMLPKPGPSDVLFQVLEKITADIGSVASINSQLIADSTNTGPVGTTYALIAENAHVFNSIFTRQHRAKAHEFKILHNLNYRHLDDKVTVQIFGGELIVSRQDFDGGIAVMPVSDPNCSTVAERVGRLQVIGDLGQKFPGILNPQGVVKMALDVIGVPELDSLLNPVPPPPVARDPMANLEAIIQGMPVNAFPEQVADCDYHIAFYTQILRDPAFGGNKYLVQTGFTAKLLQLIMSFQLLRTKNMFNTGITGQKDSLKPLIGLNAPPMPPVIEHNMIAKMVNPELMSQVLMANRYAFDQIQPDIEESLKHMPPQPVDPEMVYAISERDKVKSETENEATKLAIEAAKISAGEKEAENRENQANLRALISAIKGLPPDVNLFGHLPTNIPDSLKQLAASIDQIRKAATPLPEVTPPSINQPNPPAGVPAPSGPNPTPSPLGNNLNGSMSFTPGQ